MQQVRAWIYDRGGENKKRKVQPFRGALSVEWRRRRRKRPLCTFVSQTCCPPSGSVHYLCIENCDGNNEAR